MNNIERIKSKKSKYLLFCRKLVDTYSVIDALNLGCVLEKLCAPAEKGQGYGWPNKDAAITISAYKNYLKQVAKFYYEQGENLISNKGLRIESNDKSIPPQLIDIVWHTHIIFTSKYFKDCKQIFGFYLHHLPDIKET